MYDLYGFVWLEVFRISCFGKYEVLGFYLGYVNYNFCIRLGIDKCDV